MILIAKLLLSAATALLALAYTAPDVGRYRLRLVIGLGVALVLVLVLAVWGLTVHWPLRPAYWLVAALGRDGAALAAGLQQALGVAGLLAWIALIVVEALRLRLVVWLLWAVPILWGLVFVSGMFMYY